MTYDTAETTPEQIVAAINRQTFYHATLPELGHEAAAQPSGGMGQIVYLALAGGVSLLIVAWYRRRSRPSSPLTEDTPEEMSHG